MLSLTYVKHNNAFLLHIFLFVYFLQGQCHSLRAINAAEKIVVVDAYADGLYDRSSFHLAGHQSPVVTVASELIKGAIQGLLVTPDLYDECESRHPFVGIVDHVSVMPLEFNDEASGDTQPHDKEGVISYSLTGNAARDIGKGMEDLGLDVLYYGDAHPEKTPLATVRREQTFFFRTGGLNCPPPKTRPSKAGVATVGAPPSFVENYNVRLRSGKLTARSLTKLLRERDGGLVGVEALTLPYGNGRYEIACNLLRPHVGSVEALKAKVKEWASRTDNKHAEVEKGYRVGTTVDQCLEAISVSDSVEGAIEHDEAVMERFREYLNNS